MAKRQINKVVQIQLPPKLLPVFTGEARYRGAYGGRGSGKSRSFAKMAALRAIQLAEGGEKGIILCAREFMNTVEDSSFAEIKAAILEEDWLRSYFDIGERFIRTKDGRIAFSFIGLHHNLNSIKSKSRIRILWVDEAENISEIAWLKAIPSIREEGSEIWVTWNPERSNSATHKRFRLTQLSNAKIVELNWRDNPWFPKTLNEERLRDLEVRPEYYNHIWEGGFLTTLEGSYFLKEIQKAKEEQRIGFVAADPLLRLQAFWDIGGTGARADATSIWIAQFVGQEIRILDYYEAQGQPLAAHVAWLREKGYEKALMVLPHDGASCDRVFNTSFETALAEAGFECYVVRNQGAGAARMRIEAARRLFPKMWFHVEKTQAGIEALQWYHEKRDPIRGIGLGPAHDWSSHAADAFGLMCILYEQPKNKVAERQRYRQNYDGGTSWMAN